MLNEGLGQHDPSCGNAAVDRPEVLYYVVIGLSKFFQIRDIGPSKSRCQI